MGRGVRSLSTLVTVGILVAAAVAPPSLSAATFGPLCFAGHIKVGNGTLVSPFFDYKLVFTVDDAVGKTFTVAGSKQDAGSTSVPSTLGAVNGSGFLAADGDTVHLLLTQPEGVQDSPTPGVSFLRIQFSALTGEGTGSCVTLSGGQSVFFCQGVQGGVILWSRSACVPGGPF